MGKTPVFGMVGFCWLGLALAGCNTCGTNNTVPKDRYQARTTFGNTNKDGTVSKDAVPDAAAKIKPASMAPLEEKAAKLPDAGPANRTGGSGMLPDTVGERYDSVRHGSQHSPGEAGLVDVSPAGMKKPSTFAGDKPVTPVAGAEDGTHRLSTSNAPQPSSSGEAMLPPGSTGVVLPPPPGSSGPAMRPIATSAPRIESATSLPSPVAPGGMKPLDSPAGPPALMPAEEHGPIYDAPPPPAPPATKAAAPSATVTDAPPPAPPAMPFIGAAPNSVRKE